MNFSENTREQRYAKAKEQVEKLKGFYTHATIYTVFVFVFIWLNMQSTSYPWAIFPIAGWGLGVLGHAADTFQFNIFFGKDWESRKIKELMDEDSHSF
ncbi:MAG: 2TM domain-containing protein [Bacteroidetes bacterium]|nr:2TM domain-containing protein [Bacteroidota bacterium]